MGCARSRGTNGQLGQKGVDLSFHLHDQRDVPAVCYYGTFMIHTYVPSCRSWGVREGGGTGTWTGARVTLVRP